jgi:hypothetical protein
MIGWRGNRHHPGRAGESGEEMPWIIDKDLHPSPGAEPGTDGNATGRVGPRTYKGDGSELAHEFRILGGDRQVCFEGRSGARDLAPLKQFGMPYAGCTTIQYKVDGTWQDLERPTRPRRRRTPLDWDSLLAGIKVYRRSNSVPLPKAGALDAYDKATGFRLPEGYRRFVLTLGPGDVGDAFRVAAPGYPKNRDTVDLAKMNRRYRAGVDSSSEADLAAKYDDPERVRRLVVFCDTGGADYYGWDPQDVRDAAAHECGVYLAPRHGSQVENVAGSFLEFIGEYCLGPGYRARFLDKSLAPKKIFAAAGDYRDEGS